MNEAHVIRIGDHVKAVVLGGIEQAERVRDQLAEAHFQTCRWNYQPPYAEHWPGTTPYEKYRNHVLWNIVTVQVYNTRTPTQEEINLSLTNGRMLLNARRYEYLRNCHWSESPMAVVVNPKAAIRLGHDSPSGERLDSLIDGKMAK